jgi:hypothetical protein
MSLYVGTDLVNHVEGTAGARIGPAYVPVSTGGDPAGYVHGNGLQTAGKRRPKTMRKKRRTKHKTSSRSRTGRRHRRKHPKKHSKTSHKKHPKKHTKKARRTRRTRRVRVQNGSGGYHTLGVPHTSGGGVNHDLIGTGPVAGRAPITPTADCGKTA